MTPDPPELVTQSDIDTMRILDLFFGSRKGKVPKAVRHSGGQKRNKAKAKAQRRARRRNRH